MYEFVIIGGGIYGCYVAWELAKQGASVCLLEENAIASGASGGLGKRGVRANNRDARELPLMRLAYKIWPVLNEEIRAETGYERTGHLLLVERQLDLKRLRQQAWLQRQKGIETVVLEKGAVQEREPALGPAVIAAILCPRDGIADHSTTTRGVAAAARRLGVDIYENEAVIAIEKRDNRIQSVVTSSGRAVHVKNRVFLLSNAHSQSFLQKHFGLYLPGTKEYPQAMLLEPSPTTKINHLIGHAHRKLSIKTVGDSQIMISGGWRGRMDPETGKGIALEDQVEGNRREAAAVLPGLANISLAEARADRPEFMAVDGIPMIDEVPGIDNLIYACGWSGHGWAIAPAVSRMLAEWALTGSRPALLEPFRYARFL